MIEKPAHVVARFERQDVFVNRRERGKIESMRQFFVTGAIAVLLDEVRDEVEDFFLPLGESHAMIVGEEKGKRQGVPRA